MNTINAMNEVKEVAQLNETKNEELKNSVDTLNSKVTNYLNTLSYTKSVLNAEIEKKTALINKTNEQINYWDNLNQELIDFCKNSGVASLSSIDNADIANDSYKNMSVPQDRFFTEEDITVLKSLNLNTDSLVTTNTGENILSDGEVINISDLNEESNTPHVTFGNSTAPASPTEDTEPASPTEDTEPVSPTEDIAPASPTSPAPPTPALP